MVHVLAQIAAATAGAIHVLIFCLESVWFQRRAVYRRFLVADDAEAQAIRPWAFNQGFYNLFLAVACLAGVVIVHTGSSTVGKTLALYGCASMVAVALILLATDRRMLRGALMQGTAPAVALLAVAVSS